MIRSYTITELSMSCSVDTVHLGLNYLPSIQLYLMLSIPSLMNLFSSLNTFGQYLWTFVIFIASKEIKMAPTILHRYHISFCLATEPHTWNSVNLFIALEKEHFSTKCLWIFWKLLFSNLTIHFKSVSEAADFFAMAFAD